MIFTNFNEFINQFNNREVFKLACLDIGEKKVGTATALSNLSLVNPGLAFRRATLIEDIKFLKTFFYENFIHGIVIGLPLQMDGHEGKQCESIRKYVGQLDEALKMPIFFQDERLTTAFANRLTKEAGLTRKKGNQFDDSIAALLTLESFMKKIQN